MTLKEEILQLTNRGLEVFYFYMPIEFVPKRNFRNPLYDDKRASCNIYFDSKSDSYRMKDFGNEAYSGDCFWFAATILGLDVRSEFKKVLVTIIQDLNLKISIEYRRDTNMKAARSTYPRQSVEQSQKRCTESMDKVEYIANKKSFRVYERPFTQKELAFWEQYEISLETLEQYHVKSLSCYESVSREGKPFKLISSSEEPIFCYAHNDFVKIYRPNSKLRFLYGGEKSEEYVFGLAQLPNKGDILFITGGEKDVLSLSAHHFNAICFNSETAQIPRGIIESLSLRFLHLIILYDSDETGIREAQKQVEALSEFGVLRLQLPLSGIKTEKDISDYFALGHRQQDLRDLLARMFSSLYSETMMILQSCEIDYDNPPDVSKSVVSVNGVPLGSQDNLFCITGGEGTGKSNYIGSILAGTLCAERLDSERTLGLRRADIETVPDFYHSLYLASLSRKDRLKLIRESMDLFRHKHGGIHLVVIDGIADLVRSANDETESIAVVDELYRLAGIYNTCIICVLHFVPNGIKLRGHIGSELQRKSAGILSIEKDDNPEYSVVKALKVRDGSPLDVPMMLFGWDKELEMHVYRGEKSKEDKEKRKTDELISIVTEIFQSNRRLSYQELCDVLMREMGVKERTAKKYIAYMREQRILSQDTAGNYQKGELCHT